MKRTRKTANGLKNLSSGFQFSPLMREVIDGSESWEDFGARLEALGQASRERFPEISKELRKTLDLYSPLSCLSVCAYYGTAYEYGTDPDSNPAVSPSNTELIQGLLLTMDYTHGEKRGPCTIRQYAYIVALVLALKEAFTTRRFESIRQRSIEQNQSAMLQESVRDHTAVVRNSGTPQQIRATAETICQIFDKALDIQPGSIGLATKMSLLWRIQDITGKRILAHSEKVQEFQKLTSVRSRWKKYYELFQPPVDYDEWLKGLLSFSPEMAKQTIHAHSDLSLPGVYSISCDEILAEIPVHQAAELKEIIFGHAFRFGELKQFDTEALLLDNPIWSKPLVALGENHVMLACPNCITSNYLELLEKLVPVEQIEQFYKAKADYLEMETARCFRTALPEAKCFRSAKWGNDGENDLVAILDRTLLIVESKSAKFSSLAKMGSVDRLKREAGRLINKPTEQSGRLLSRIRELPEGVAIQSTQVGKAQLVCADFDHHICLSVTLEHLGALSATSSALPAEVRGRSATAPSMCIHELQSVVDILGNDYTLLDFLRKRTNFHRETEYVADEIDLLVVYLDDNDSHILDLDYHRPDPIFRYGRSTEFNPYFLGFARKPEKKLTRFWGSLLRRARKMRSHWVDATGVLLSTPLPQQRSLEAAARKTLKILQRNKDEERNTEVLGNKNLALAISYHRGLRKEERNVFLRSMANAIFEEGSAKELLVFSIDLNTLEKGAFEGNRLENMIEDSAVFYIANLGSSPGAGTQR